ncbi:MAG: alanine racemase, partial [Chloroflexi bacterium]|nr:alanine racemase [Chloroflexota bacterium]
LSEAAQSAGVTLNVLVDIHTRLERCGVEPGRPALALAREISKSKGLRFAGLTSYEGAILADSADDLIAESKRCIQQVLDTRELIEKDGLEVEVVSVGGTHNYEVAGAMSGVTEVPAGSYALMDARYASHRPQLKNAAKVLATVISHPQPDLALLDVGQKAISIDTGIPVSADIPNTRFERASAEHGFLRLAEGAQKAVDIKSKVLLIPWEIGNTANIYDYIHAARDGRLEALWDVSARGRYR